MSKEKVYSLQKIKKEKKERNILMIHDKDIVAETYKKS